MYFNSRKDIKYIEKKKKSIDERLLILEQKIDLIINKLKDK